ncbi:GntR family transcriptional regulator [Tritonibacter horizontis]|uniref:Putative HTH-type transcriptional regulator YurK n=1 Tax=Tritonibacter horizontis TaxID=1768241 RepID=A0A132BXZ0_9RHOB|nr:GntR family transcriptional regulator [Tritonibacter horizontis]KUP93245.1 putative HTH-type transcriptional regulator YurK [Tritonibacter horizontis]
MQQPKKTGFQDVRDEVMRRIETRVWDQGALLPTEAELATEFGCARATVNRALRELADRGVIDRKRKSGTRVTALPVKQAKLEIATARRLVEERNATYRYALVSRRMQAAPGWLGSQMGLTPGTEVLHLEAMHYGDGQPFHFEDRWINIAAVPGCAEADFALKPPGEWLLAEVPFSNADVSFTATAADAALADYLACAPGAALFQMERSTWFQDAPVTFARMTFHPGYRMRSRY